MLLPTSTRCETAPTCWMAMSGGRRTVLIPDSVGTMIILHDATLDRITNCRGTVSSWLWSSISAQCRTDVGGQKLMRLVDLLKYGNSLGKSFALELKVASITDAQAKQFWNAIRTPGFSSQLRPPGLPH